MRRRLQAELLAKQDAPIAEGGERVCLAACAVEGEHQLTAQALPQRVSRDEGLEFRDQPIAVAEGELRVDALLRRLEGELLQALDVRLCERLVLHVGQGASAPQRLGLAQLASRELVLACVERAGAVGCKPLEAIEIQLTGPRPQQVSRRPGDETRAVVSERLAQPGDIRVERVASRRRWTLAPKPVDEAIA